MTEKLYKTSEVAKLHGISKKTLLYYEKIGLFKSDYINESNNYRYYTRKNFPILKQIIYLKNIGFDLNQIKFMLENRTHDLMIKELKSRGEKLKIEIETLTQTKKDVDYLINFYEKANLIMDNDLNRPSLQFYECRKIYRQKASSNTKESVMLTYRKMLNHLRDLSLFSHHGYGTVYHLNETELSTTIDSFISLPANFNINNEKILPGGKYISMYHIGSYYNEQPLNFLIDWLKKNNYEPIGDFYDYCVIDRSFTNNEDEMIMELQVQVK